MFDRVCICLHVFVSKKIQKRKLTESSAQNIFGDPRYSQVSPWVSVDFPGKKSIELRYRPPMLAYIQKNLCIHWFLSVVPPTKHTFSGSIPLPIIYFQHLALIHASF